MVNEPSPSSGVVVDEPHDDYMAGRFCIQLVFQTDNRRTELGNSADRLRHDAAGDGRDQSGQPGAVLGCQRSMAATKPDSVAPAVLLAHGTGLLRPHTNFKTGASAT